MTDQCKAAIANLLSRYIEKHNAIYGELPTVNFDPPWPSECLTTESDAKEHQQHWKPAARSGHALFSSLEQGLGFSFPDEIKTYYGSFWSNGLCVDYGQYSLNLIQVWNKEDEENLQHNMLGHCYARLKGKLPLGYFIGSTGENVLSLCHETGNIVLEKPGKKAHALIAPDLATFLNGCAPNLKNYD